jgi:peptidylprolyl isomerase
MDAIKEGDKVSILFEAKLESGETILKTEDENALALVVGSGEIPISIEKALVDMKIGESKTVTLEPAEAFGPRIDDLVIDLPKEGFGDDSCLDIGSTVVMNSPQGKKFRGTVLKVEGENVTVDFNHPLAGRTLVFSVTVVSIGAT